MTSGQKFHVDFTYPVAPVVGKSHEETVPVVSQMNFLERLALESFHGVKVPHRHIEQNPGEQIIGIGNEPFAVFAHFPAADYIVFALPDFIQKARDLLGRMLHICVIEHHHIRARSGVSGQHGLGLAEIGPVPEKFQPCFLAGQALCCLIGAVRAAVIHKHDLTFQPMPVEHGAQRADKLRDVFNFIVSRHEHRDIGLGV